MHVWLCGMAALKPPDLRDVTAQPEGLVGVRSCECSCKGTRSTLPHLQSQQVLLHPLSAQCHAVAFISQHSRRGPLWQSHSAAARLLHKSLLQHVAEGKAVLSPCLKQQLPAFCWLAVPSLCSILTSQ